MSKTKTKGKKLTLDDFPKPPEIKYTLDYDQFKFSDHNRDIIRSNVDKLKVSIKENKSTVPHNPGLIGEGKYILDGQNFLTALKELQEEHGHPVMPFYYTENPELKPTLASTLNSARKNWSLSSYLSHFASRGFKKYEDLEDLLSRFPFPIYTGLSLYYKGHHKCGGEAINNFKRGKLKDTGKSVAEEIGQQLTELREECGVDFAFLQNFIIAWVQVYRNQKRRNEKGLDEFDFELFKEKLQEDPSQLSKRPSYTEHLRDIERVYNRRNRKQKRLF